MNRNGLKKHVEDWITRLGGQSAVAKRCKISSASLSLWLQGKYGADTTTLEKKIAQALGYKESGWQVCRNIANYRTIKMWYDNARQERMWIAVSNCAGSGKTQTLEDLCNEDLTGAVVYLQAEEWSPRQFLTVLAEKTCGMPKTGYTRVDDMISMITAYLNAMVDMKPLLVIDEADKLKPSAFRKLIPLYNRTEGRTGCLLAGTGNLKKEIKSGVRRDAKGYDEIDSRLGRSYIGLPGATEQDVLAIATANGLNDAQAARVWEDCEKVRVPMKVRLKNGSTSEKMVFVCEDLRRVARLVKREQLIGTIGN